MSVRRRAFRSSSQGDLTVFNQIRPVESPVEFLEIKDNKCPSLVTNVKSREEQHSPRRVEWTIGSPEVEQDDSPWNKKEVGEGYGEFLKACCLCKKKLEETADVYMYGHLGAFCSSECRDDQMALDGFGKEVSKETAKMTLGGMISTKDRQGLGAKRFK